MIAVMGPFHDRRIGATDGAFSDISETLCHFYPLGFYPKDMQMARRRFEMFHYRQALVRMRQGDSDRQIATARIMGRRLAARLRELAAEHNWLDPAAAMPENEPIDMALVQPKRARTTIPSLEAQRQKIQGWAEQGVSGVAIFAALQRVQGWSGSYSAVRRILADIRRDEPPETSCRLDFSPGEAVQVDFGASPMLLHPDAKLRRTWALVMTLCFSRHQYVEFVWDQSAATWLGCYRRAFEWFGAVPRRVTIDNAKCAITKACAKDPTVQRAYAECAEGYGFKIDPCPPYDPQKKGIVESGVKYIKGNFLALRQYRMLTPIQEFSCTPRWSVFGKRQHVQPEYPFWRLQKDGIWVVEHDRPLKVRTSNTDIPRTELRAANARGHFTPDVLSTLQQDPKQIYEIARSLLDAHFPETLHEDILSAVGLAHQWPGTIEVAKKRHRDTRFRASVLTAYQYRCAVCQLDLRIGSLTVGLEAAHIKWHTAVGPDAVENGLALCSIHHKLFDYGAFTLSAGNQQTILVSEHVHGSTGFEEVLLRHHGQKLAQPVHKSQVPKPEYAEWQMKEVFKSEARPLT